MMNLRFLPAALLLLGLGSCFTVQGVDAAATPQRPTVSSDTNTTAEGTLELEAGFARNDGKDLAAPLSLKYGAGPATEVFLANSPYVRLERPTADVEGSSDLVVGIRHRLWDADEDGPAAAIQVALELPTADRSDGFSNGATDAFFAGILSGSVGSVGTTAFYSLDVLGQQGGGTEVGHTLALAAGQPLGSEVGAFAELAGSVVPDLDVESYLGTVGLTYSKEPSVVFDLALVLGLNDEAPDWQVLLGVTRNLGKVTPR